MGGRESRLKKYAIMIEECNIGLYGVANIVMALWEFLRLCPIRENKSSPMNLLLNSTNLFCESLINSLPGFPTV